MGACASSAAHPGRSAGEEPVVDPAAVLPTVAPGRSASQLWKKAAVASRAVAAFQKAGEEAQQREAAAKEQEAQVLRANSARKNAHFGARRRGLTKAISSIPDTIGQIYSVMDVRRISRMSSSKSRARPGGPSARASSQPSSQRSDDGEDERDHDEDEAARQVRLERLRRTKLKLRAIFRFAGGLRMRPDAAEGSGRRSGSRSSRALPAVVDDDEAGAARFSTLQSSLGTISEAGSERSRRVSQWTDEELALVVERIRSEGRAAAKIQAACRHRLARRELGVERPLRPPPPAAEGGRDGEVVVAAAAVDASPPPRLLAELEAVQQQQRRHSSVEEWPSNPQDRRIARGGAERRVSSVL